MFKFDHFTRIYYLCCFTNDKLEIVCRPDLTGWEYRGSINLTVTGKKCAEWNEVEPESDDEEALNPAAFPEVSLKEAKNFCRNPEATAFSPWCFLDKDKDEKEPCFVPLCNDRG